MSLNAGSAASEPGTMSGAIYDALNALVTETEDRDIILRQVAQSIAVGVVAHLLSNLEVDPDTGEVS